LEQVVELGYQGVLFRSILDLHPSLDPAALAEVRAHADELGLRMEAGVAKVNPYMTAELPEIRDLGGGDYVRAVTRMIQACAAIGISELWTATAGWKRQYPGRFQYDRFRTDAPWSDQLAAIERLVRILRPALLDTGCHLNLETHEEITSPELVRLVEAVGPDVVGITFDVANVAVRGEHPTLAARRCAPYTRMTHLRDVALWPTPTGFLRFVVPFGEGLIDWPDVLDILHTAPLAMITVEGLEHGGLRSCKPVDHREQAWRDGHPDLVASEVDALAHLAWEYATRAEVGDCADLETLLGTGDQHAFLASAHKFLTHSLNRGAAL
jgi:sugar phosphate isomerase/epimerase